MLGRAGKTPPPGEAEFLRKIVNRPVQYPGTIAPADYFFLTAFVSLLAPQRVVEIGTLTGFSAAIIAAALRRRSERDSPSWVDTIDLLPKCLIDEAHPTGFRDRRIISRTYLDDSFAHPARFDSHQQTG